ncbi:MAG: hypothetical protein SVV03_05535 [Candidatus Nanohaloarchaea archaeon]|nr:hypothetical protein [Candidatus Nanohaloarchaea archaeon]
MGLDEINRREEEQIKGLRSKEYKKYQEAEERSVGTLYEKWGKKLGNLKGIDLSQLSFLEGTMEQIQKDMDTARMRLSNSEIGALLIIPFLAMLVALIPITFFLPITITVFFWVVPFFWVYWVMSYPGFSATVTRIKSSDEALRVILYMAMQLDMSPSLEKAIRTAADHSDGPISRDFAKILWDTQTNKYTTLKEGLSAYMDRWREWSPDFTRSMEFLIDSTTRSGEGRTRMIQKGQQTIIDATKTKMQEYARNLSSPVKVIHLAGIVLPLMGLIMFPLVSVFLGQGSIGGITSLVAFGYLIVLPLFLYFLVKRLISKRPGAYSHPSLKNVPDLPPKHSLIFTAGSKKYYIPLKLFAITLAFLIMIPGLLHFIDLFSTIISHQTGLEILGSRAVTSQGWQNFIDEQYKVANLVPNVVQAMSVIWGVIIGFVVYLFGKSYRRKRIRETIKEIEEDIDVSLTELENALSKQMPIERSVYDVVDSLRDLGKDSHPLYGFFSSLLNKMESVGLKFKDAIFDPERGAIKYYPSNMLRNAMKVVADAAMKGSQAMASTIRTVSEYIQNQKKIEEVIKQLLSEVVDQMKMLGRFIAPIITAAAASMSILIVEIIFAVSQQLEKIQRQMNLGGAQGMSAITEQISLIKSIESSLPPTGMLLIVGLYMIEVSLILGYFTSGIEHGFDEINQDLELGKTLIYAGVIFSVIVLISSIYVTPLLAKL